MEIGYTNSVSVFYYGLAKEVWSHAVLEKETENP